MNCVLVLALVKFPRKRKTNLSWGEKRPKCKMTFKKVLSQVEALDQWQTFVSLKLSNLEPKEGARIRYHTIRMIRLQVYPVYWIHGFISWPRNRLDWSCHGRWSRFESHCQLILSEALPNPGLVLYQVSLAYRDLLYKFSSHAWLNTNRVTAFNQDSTAKKTAFEPIVFRNTLSCAISSISIRCIAATFCQTHLTPLTSLVLWLDQIILYLFKNVW